ncbi:carbohydrate kinase [Arthrobacter sp. NPDC058130]|uniref:carbohydrate kinase family protein n=1 Tax=Arthrobacter sp. NPDC058130 TaxID=3346353 RepID=UPI0036EBD3DF
MTGAPAPGSVHPEVVVVGESLIDIISTVTGPVEYAGGSGLNVAFGLGRLGRATALLTVLGADQRGQAIRQHLDSAGVELLPGAVRLKRTSTAKATLDSWGAAHYTFDIEWNLPPVAPTFAPRVLHACSLATFLEPGATQVRSLLAFFNGRCLITYDPNIRPGIIGDHDKAQRTFERTASLATLVKLSDEDAAWLYPGLAIGDVARHILGLGVKAVVVTAGAEGANLYSDLDHVSVPAPAVTVADTVGAGDSFMASIIASLLECPEQDFDRQQLERLGTVAAAAAAITVTRHGANPPTAAELDEALALSV